MITLNFILIWFIFSFDFYVLGEVDIIVETVNGKIEGGMKVSRNGNNFLAFSGIPYAKPPIGNLRFETPQPAESWTGLRPAKEDGPLCPQVNVYMGGPPSGSEDCLYLTVYTQPANVNAAVMVHLHGGGWILGGGPRAKGPEYLMDQPIVIVDINYRIGILGFLSLEEEDLPGNMGLKDQLMALRWVRDNIASFGGNPNQVVLMGECAGADSVYLHMVSPLSQGLFAGGIAESGSGFTLQAVAPPGLPRQRALKLAEMMNCSGPQAKAMVACLRSKDALDIAAKLPSFLEWQIDPVYSFGPVLEQEGADSFLVGPVSQWNPAQVPLLTGITSGEGLLRTVFLHRNIDWSALSKDFNKRMILTLMLNETSTRPEEVVEKVRQYYVPAQDLSETDFHNITDMIGDVWFTAGVLEGAERAKGPVFMYQFDYTGAVSFSHFFGDTSIATGAFHADEQLYLWKFAGLPPFQGKDLQMSQDLVKLFTNFIKTGDPGTPENILKFKWTPYNPDGNYLSIKEAGFKIDKGLLTDRYLFLKGLNFRDKFV